jgi:heat shock protein HslJ
VVFLRDGACSDQMSDTQHPVSASVSLPDLRFLVGCCRIPAAPAAAAAAAVSLEGPSWRLTGLPGKDKAALGSLPRPITARFERGRVTGFSGCNNFMGGYSLEGDRLRLDPLAGTMMACPEPAMSIENAFKAAFAGTLRYAIAGERLTLTSPAGATLSFEKEPPPRLEGVTWEATGFNNNREAVVGLKLGTRITFSFADGTVSGNAGCNNFHGPYNAERNHIKIGPLATTFRMCDESLMTQEKQFLAALESAVVWAIDGGMLDMHRADEQRALTAKAAK